MSVIINQKSEELFLVNGKEVFKDSENNWICRTELSTHEYEHFIKHINSLIKNK